MPTLAASRIPRPESLARVMPTQTTAPAPAPPATGRSPLMIASIPGVGSGPDAVTKQFNGGRPVSQTRIFVP